ncbi:MAG: aminotransferase class III-fold pyridoxal phosphate-dependent enzyme [Bacteroidota bacterium]
MPTPLSLIAKHYQLTGNLTALPGEFDLNFRLQSDSGEQYICKFSPPDAEPEHLSFQLAILEHLAQKELEIALPQVIRSTTDERMVAVEIDRETRWLRVLTWVDGKVWAKVNPHTSNMWEELGALSARLCKGLFDFDHPQAHRPFKWNSAAAEWVDEALAKISDPGRRILLQDTLSLFREKVLPLQDQLRKSVIHNDANDHNILVAGEAGNRKVVSVIDFGDAIHTWTINDLAIAAAYACMKQPDPVDTIFHLVKGFHQTFPLHESEIKVLFALIQTRLLISLTVSSLNAIQHPENEYLQISANDGWALLTKLSQIHPDFAEYRFREACGWEPDPNSQSLTKWLKQQSFAEILGEKPDPATLYTFDLSVGSLEIGNNVEYLDSVHFDRKLFRILADEGKKIGIGRYGEIRPLYTTDAYVEAGNQGVEWRTMHTGLDVFTEAETAIHAPLDGRIHSFADNAGDKNYGPTIILEHQADDGLRFFTLYGHLSKESLVGKKIGQKIEGGEVFCWLGNLRENGEWPPHLHFQIMTNLLGYEGDFPGVAKVHEQKTWQSISPDPNLILKWDIPELADEMSHAAILAVRKKHLSPSLSLSYRQPLHMQRAFGQYLFAADGRRYLDTVNNVPHVGHQHPRVVEAARRQFSVLNTNTRYLHKEVVQLAEELAASFPDPLEVCFFVNSGSEANELAMRMARTITRQQDMLAVEVGYHGNTAACIEVSSYKFDGPGGGGKSPRVGLLPLPDVYRGLYQDVPLAGQKYASHAAIEIERIKGQGRGIAGFIGESILSCGGQIVPPTGYFQDVFQQVRVHGGLCIVDEVQVGFGRIGKHFWGFELQGVVPDIVTVGKPFGNGHPLGAVITTREIADAFANGMEFFSTFGGAQVSATIGREVLRIVKDEGRQAHALQMGNVLKNGLRELQQDFPCMGDVRGEGLFLGFELVNDPEERTPDAEKASYLANRMRERGILMSTDGPDHNVIKIKPPMVFNQQNADFLLENLRKVFSEDAMQ